MKICFSITHKLSSSYLAVRGPTSLMRCNFLLHPWHIHPSRKMRRCFSSEDGYHSNMPCHVELSVEQDVTFGSPIPRTWSFSLSIITYGCLTDCLRYILCIWDSSVVGGLYAFLSSFLPQMAGSFVQSLFDDWSDIDQAQIFETWHDSPLHWGIKTTRDLVRVRWLIGSVYDRRKYIQIHKIQCHCWCFRRWSVVRLRQLEKIKSTQNFISWGTAGGNFIPVSRFQSCFTVGLSFCSSQLTRNSSAWVCR